MAKHKASKQQRTPPSTGGGGPSGGGGGGGILDKLLVPRLINFAMNNRLDDVDEVALQMTTHEHTYIPPSGPQ